MTKDLYVIAEIGSNHNGDLETAIKLIDMAALAGADAVKFQKRHNATLFTDKLYHKPYEGYGPTYGTHRVALDFDFEQFKTLQKYADSKNIDFFATPFDTKSVDFLEALEVSQYKIASASVTNHRLIRRIVETGKPIFMSVGGQSDNAIKQALIFVDSNYPLTIFHCVALYPCPPEMMNLQRIPVLRNFFGFPVGLSDHQDGIALGAAAYALGARVFEKHITLNHSDKGTDHAFSLEYFGLHQYIKYLNAAAKAMIWHDQPMEDEMAAILKMSQSLYWAIDLDAGERIKSEHIAVQSPGHSDGLYPTPLTVSKFVRRLLDQSVIRGDLLRWENIR